MIPYQKEDYTDLELTGLPVEFFYKNRQQYMINLKNMLTGIEKDSIIVLQGGNDLMRYDTDLLYWHFVQDGNFYYLTGVREGSFYAMIDVKDYSGNMTLFFNPPSDPKAKVFQRIPTLEELAEKYQVPVFDQKDIYTQISNRNPVKIYVLSGKNSDSGVDILPAALTFPHPYEKYQTRIDSNHYIYEILADTRTRKTEDEIAYMSYLCSISVDGMRNAIKKIKPGLLEKNIEVTYYNYMQRHYYVRHTFPLVCGAGIDSSYLHYIINDKEMKDGDMMLCDMGVKLCEYFSDITFTVPVNGKFTDKQKGIYNLVLNTNREVEKNIKPGAYWPEMHKLAEAVILEGLVKLKILKEEFSIDDMLKDRLAYYFMPHGLGHFVGIDLHDVGGYLSFTPPRMKEKGFDKLRTARYLSIGNVITVEPGIYFIPFLLDMGLADETVKKYFNEPVLKEYYSFGGVRVEDDVLVTRTGCRILTEGLPRTVEEIEAFMKK